jgi:hypothetical protein
VLDLIAQAAPPSNTTVSLEAIAITAGAVVLAALITQFATHLRLKRQLEAERKRLSDQLDAERARLADRLDAERQRLRQQLDQDLALAAEAEKHARENELLTVLEHAGIRLSESIRVVDRLRSGLLDLDHGQLAPLGVELEQLWANEDRISVRLGINAPGSERYRAASEHLGRAHFILSEIAAGAAVDTARRGALELARDTAMQEQRAFFELSSKRVGPRSEET